MKNTIIKAVLILTVISSLVSCSHQGVATPKRYLASKECPVKGEYHSYFDEVEKCIEKEHE